MTRPSIMTSATPPQGAPSNTSDPTALSKDSQLWESTSLSLLDKLPTEILQRALNFVHDDDLLCVEAPAPGHLATICNVSRTSKILHQNAERPLYKSVRIQDITELSPLLDALARQPTRFGMIREMHLGLKMCQCELRDSLSVQQLRQQADVLIRKVTSLLTDAANIKFLVLNLDHCGMYDYREDDEGFNCYSFFKGLHQAIADHVINPEVEFLPRLRTLAFKNTSDYEDIAHYFDILRLPSLRCMISLDFHDSGWHHLEGAGWNHLPPERRDEGLVPATFPSIKHVSIRKTGMFPNEIGMVSTMFPHLETFEVISSNTATEERYGWHFDDVMKYSEQLILWNLNSNLEDCCHLVKLVLNTHWWNHSIVDPGFMSLLGHNGAVECLCDLTKLTTLTIGMHLLRSRVETEEDAGDFLSPEVLPPNLETLTLFLCAECFQAPWDDDEGQRTHEKFLTALMFVRKLADATARGEFPKLKQVKFVSQTEAWVVSGCDNRDHQWSRKDADGQAWYPGLFIEDVDRFGDSGVRFKAVRSDEFCCKAPHMA